jgi:hypothetical protein
VVAFLLLAYVVASHALTDGLCCADDGAISLVAKSVAAGDGYSLPLNFISESGRFAYHPGISTGPTLVLPAAALIAVFGPQIWVPSVVTAIFALTILGLMGRHAGKLFGVERGSIFLIGLILLLYVVTSGEYFVHWYALLGEIPGLLLLALAAYFAAGGARGEWSARSSFIAGLLGGLAVNSKLLALIGALAIGGLYAWRLLKQDRAQALREGLFYTVGLALPIVVFELFRLHALGFSGYYHWLGGMRGFAASQMPALASGGAKVGRLDQAIGIVRGFHDATGVTWLCLGLPVLTVAALTLRDRRFVVAARVSLLCGVAAITYAVWWLGFSNGWPRYALMGLGLFAVSAAWAAAAAKSNRLAIIFVAAMLLVVLPWNQLGRVSAPVRYAAENGFLENQRVTNLRATARFVNGAGNRSVLVGSWWASLVAVEFLSSQSQRTVGFNRLYSARADLPGTLLLRDTTWDDMSGLPQDPAFQKFESHCSDVVFSAPPYKVERCNLSPK